MEGKFVAYHRVSTQQQGRSGLGLEAQRKAVLDYLNEGGWELIDEFTEVESGKKGDRPELAAALALCKKQKAKLLIAKLDRLARNVHFISGLMESGVDFVAADLPQANKLTVHILAAVAEAEREAISQRTKVALAAAKERGVVLGNPHLDKARPKAWKANRDQAQRRAEAVLPLIHGIKSAGITSLAGIANALNARGVPTPRGGDWYATSVKNVLART